MSEQTSNSDEPRDVLREMEIDCRKLLDHILVASGQDPEFLSDSLVEIDEDIETLLARLEESHDQYRDLVEVDQNQT